MTFMPLKKGQPGYGALLDGILNPQMAPNLNAGFGAPVQSKPKFLQQGGMGRHIAGAIGDMLLQQAGMQPVYAPTMQQQRQSEQEEAQWTRRREADNEDWQNRQAWSLANKPPEVSPMVRDAQAWATMTPDQRAAYEQMKKAQAGDPEVTVTLPNGQLYIGPKSGLGTALGGGAPSAVAAPVGRLTPINGGPASAPGTFRP